MKVGGDGGEDSRRSDILEQKDVSHLVACMEIIIESVHLAELLLRRGCGLEGECLWGRSNSRGKWW